MKYMKTLSDILSATDSTEELYTSDQKSRLARKNKGWYSRSDTTFDFIYLLKAWEDIVGAMLAKNSIPLKIKNKSLYITTKHPIFSQEMGFLSQEILAKIFEKFPALESLVNKIKFTNSEYHFNQSQEILNKTEQSENKARPALHPFSPEFKRKEKIAMELFSDIGDPELREILKRFYLS